MNNVRFGLDLGGTKLLGLVTTPDQNILYQKKTLLPQPVDLNTIVRLLAAMVADLQSGAGCDPPERIGLSVPSPVDVELGVAKHLVSFGLENIPLSRMLEEKIGRRVVMDNDVNLVTLAEYHLGAGRGVQSLYTFYPGTGLGGGYIQHGKLVRGFNYTAAEVGHMVILMEQNGERRYRTLESIVSNRGFRSMFKDALKSGRTSILAGETSFRSGDLVRAWKSGDEVVRDLLTFQAEIQGIGIANVINITGVERIILGGNVYHKLKEELLPIVEYTARKYAIGNGMDDVEIRLNELGNEAPALGATLLL
ncbi:MAG: ROK family protein [FCB group bacterium]|nr:ROK family protein [FCB group bacterium]